MTLKVYLTLRAAAALLLIAAGAQAQSISGAGSTFASPIFKEWFPAFRKTTPGAKVGYQAIGSGAGITKLLEGSVDFAATEDPLTNQQLSQAKEKGRDILHFPVVLGAIVPIYHVPGVDEDLNFTPAALTGIYLGKIKLWNDPEIQNANPGVKLRNDPIVVVRRQDPNGATFLWTEFLSNHSPEWKSGPGTGMNVKWPTGISAKGDEGVVSVVENTWDSIGYVELSYAVSQHLPHGKIKNSAGVFVEATPKTIEAAADHVHNISSDMRVSFHDAPGRDSFPISSFTYLLVPRKLRDLERQKVLGNLLRWILTEGQKTAENHSYGKLPDAIVKRELERLNTLFGK